MSSLNADSRAAGKRWSRGVGKRCDCPIRPRCECHWWIRLKHKGDAQSGFGPVSKFAFLLEPHQPVPTTRGGTEALAARVYDWLVKGKPMAAPAITERIGNELIDGWLIWRKTRQRLKKKSVQEADASKVRRAREIFGTMAVSQLAEPQTLHDFVNQELDRGHNIATPNRILAAVMRPAIRWGLAQEPPWLPKNPFGEHRFQIDTDAENKRTERCAPDREAKILAAVAQLGPEAEPLADFMAIAIDLGPRSDEIHRLTNADVDWHACTVLLRRTKRGEPRLVPFNPKGRVATILKRRRFAGQTALVIPCAKLFKWWVHAVCLTYDLPYGYRKRGGYLHPETIVAYKGVNLRLHDLRHEAATWWGICGVSDEDREFLQGHTNQRMQGRYSHEKLARAKAALAAKVWPREGERAVA